MHKEIADAIIRSQHCQRNWDLDRQIPQEDLDLLITSVTQCPNKQNIAFYRLHFVTNRNIIKNVAEYTNGFVIQRDPEVKTTINTQVLANLLVVFEEYNGIMNQLRNEQTREISNNNMDERTLRIVDRDMKVAVGIAAGYLNLTASILGYSTGCCSCFLDDGVQQIIGLENRPLLLMGIGFKDPSRNRRMHQNSDFIFPTLKKQEIQVKFIN